MTLRMYNAVLFMNTIIHLLLKLRDVYSFSDGSNFKHLQIKKKIYKIFLENMLYKRDYLLIFLILCLTWLITYEGVAKKKNDVFKWCFPTSPLSRQMNWGILNKNFISDIVKYMKNYYVYRQNWKVTTISTIIIFFYTWSLVSVDRWEMLNTSRVKLQEKQ